MRVRKSTVTLLLIWLGGLALAYVARATLPERYYADAQSIQTLITDPQLEFAPSFHRTATAWRMMGFGTLWPDDLAVALGYTIAIAAIGWGVRMARADWQPAVFLLLAVWCIPVAIYHGQYSKEMYTIVAIVGMLRLSGSLRGVVAAAFLALVYALLLRTYWVVIVVLWLVLLVGWRLGLSWPWRLLLVAIAILPLSTASLEGVGLRLSDGRSVSVEERNRDLDPESVTAFFNLFDTTSAATDLANTVAGWLMLIVPLYLFKLGAVQHIAFAVFQLLNTVLFAAAARRAGGASGNRAPNAQEWRYAAATSWCVAFTIVQGMFEPDFGSFLKHGTALLPMLAYIYLSAWRTPIALRQGVAVP